MKESSGVSEWLGAIIPELDGLVAAKPASLPTSGTPILPLYLRPALLARVAIIDRAGVTIHLNVRNRIQGAAILRTSI
jgi:hypothetical protein